MLLLKVANQGSMKKDYFSLQLPTKAATFQMLSMKFHDDFPKLESLGQFGVSCKVISYPCKCPTFIRSGTHLF